MDGWAEGCIRGEYRFGSLNEDADVQLQLSRACSSRHDVSRTSRASSWWVFRQSTWTPVWSLKAIVALAA
jgi:hypothetical protein